MILGTNCTTIAPLAVSELQRFETLTVESLRFNVPDTEVEIVRFLEPYVGMRIRPLLLFHRMDSVLLAPFAIRETMARLGPDGFDVEPVNEWRNQESRPMREDVVDVAKLLHGEARTQGHIGAVLAPSIMNLDKDRDIPDLKVFAAALPPDVTLNIHRYPPGVWNHPPSMRDPWPPHTVRASEFYQLREIAGEHPIAFTEFSEVYGSIPYYWGLAHTMRTPADVKVDLIDELRLLEQQGIVSAYPYAWPPGPDGFAMVGPDGQELAHAQALTEWRT